jgi:hypothetical protein
MPSGTINIPIDDFDISQSPFLGTPPCRNAGSMRPPSSEDWEAKLIYIQAGWVGQ